MHIVPGRTSPGVQSYLLAGAPSGGPVDRFVPSAASEPLMGRPMRFGAVSTRSILAAAREVLGQVAAALASQPVVSLAMTAPPEEISSALRKAAGKDAPEHFARLQALRCSDADRESLIADYARALGRGWSRRFDPRQVLDYVDGKPRAAALMRAFADLTELSGSVERGFADMKLVDAGAAKAPLDEAIKHVTTLRKRDPGRGDSYATPVDLTTAVSVSLAGVDAAQRDERLKTLDALWSGRGLDIAARHVERLGKISGPDAPAMRAAYLKLFEVRGRNCDEVFLGILDKVEAQPDPLKALEDFASILQATSNPAQADADFDLALERAPRAHVTELIARIRKADPARGNSSGFAPLEPLVDDLLAAPLGERGPRLDLLIALQSGKRNAAAVSPFDRCLRGLTCAPQERAEIRAATAKFLKEHSARTDGKFLEALQRVSDMADWRRFERVLSAVAGRVEQGANDFAMVGDAAAKHRVGIDEVIDHVSALRKTDPAQGDACEQFVDVAPAVNYVLAQPDRRDALARLQAMQSTRRGLVAALAMQNALADTRMQAVEADVLVLMNKHRRDQLIIEALQECAKQPDPEAHFQHFLTLVGSTTKVDQALGDIRMCHEVSTSKGRPVAEVVALVDRLRKADPAVGSDRGFAALQPVVEDLLGAPAGATDELIGLQQSRRNAAQVLEATQRLRGKPAEVRAAWTEVLKKYPSRNDATLTPVLQAALAAADPLAAIKGLETLTAASRSLTQAAEDLKTLLACPLALEEGVAATVALRKTEPAYRDNSEKFQPLAPVLAWVEQGSTRVERALRGERLAALVAARRTPDEAVVHETRLATVKDDALADAYRKGVVGWRRGESDKIHLKALDLCDGATDGRDALPAYGFWGDSNPTRGLADLSAVLSRAAGPAGSRVADTAALLKSIRAFERNAEDVSAALDVLLAGKTADERALRLSLMQRFAETEGSAVKAGTHVAYLLAHPGDDFAESTRRMGVVIAQVSKGVDAEHALYERLQTAAKSEPRRWWQRLLHLRHCHERTFLDVCELTHDAGTVEKIMGTLEKNRRGDEEISKALSRFQELLAVDKEATSVEAARDACDRAGTPLKFGSWSLKERWDRLHALGKELRWLDAVGVVWKCMTDASSEQEFNARRAAWDTLVREVRYNDGPSGFMK